MSIKVKAHVSGFTRVSKLLFSMTGYLDPVTDQDVLLDTTQREFGPWH